MTAQEVISHYNSNNTKVFTVLLDASKAFDRVNYINLFEKLLKREMCPLVMRLLLQTYLEQKLCVKWNDTTSEKGGSKKAKIKKNISDIFKIVPKSCQTV